MGWLVDSEHIGTHLGPGGTYLVHIFGKLKIIIPMLLGSLFCVRCAVSAEYTEVLVVDFVFLKISLHCIEIESGRSFYLL